MLAYLWKMQVRRGSRAPYQAISVRGGGIGGHSLTELSFSIYLCMFSFWTPMPTDLPTPSPWSDPDDSLSTELFRKNLEQQDKETKRLQKEGESPQVLRTLAALEADTVTVELKMTSKLHGCLQKIIDASPNTNRWHDAPIRSVLLALIKSGLRTEHDLKTSDFS